MAFFLISSFFFLLAMEDTNQIIATKNTNTGFTASPHSPIYFLAGLGSAAWEMALRISVSDIMFFML